MRLREQGGFTLVEMLVVVPIYVLIVMVMFGVLIDQYGELIKQNSRVRLQAEAQSLLLTIEDEILFATEYRETKLSNLTDYFEPSGGWNYNTNPDTLIINETALTADRRDPDREFVFNPHPFFGCAYPYTIAFDNLIYFTQDNPDDSFKTLYKRTLVPDPSSVCQTNYKVQTCPAGNIGTYNCQRDDAIISRNVVDFDVVYYDESGNVIDDETGAPLTNAERVRVVLTLGAVAYGETIQESAFISMKKIN